LRPLPPLIIPPGAYDFTYNGLWGLISGPGSQSQIVSVDGSRPPLRFPYDMDNFSCASTTQVVVITRKDRTFAAIEGTTGRTIWAKKFEPSFRGIWISPDGRRLIGSSYEGKLATIDLHTGQILRLVDAHRLNLSSLNFSRDGKMFLTGGGEGDAVLWDSDTLRRIVEFRGTGGREIEGGDISPDGKRVVTCNIAGAWQIWDRESGKELTEIRASRVSLRSVVFTADGRKILSAGEDGLVRVWAALDRDPTVRIPLPYEAAARLGSP
jgi:WD40 repeat protein